MKSIIKLLTLTALGACGPLLSMAQEKPLALQNQRELFVDDYLVEKLENMENRLATPVSAGKALVFDKPWEGRFSIAGSVIHDGGVYRMYYRGLPETGGAAKSVLCYAESADGIHWKKRLLRQVEMEGSLENNVMKEGAAFTVLYDDKPGVPPPQKYKSIKGGSKEGLSVMVSVDGFTWKPFHEQPDIPGAGKGHALDSPNVLTWVPAENQYAIYLRGWTGDTPGVTPKEPNEFGNIHPFYHGVRTLLRSTSTDLIHWTEAVRMDFGDSPLEHFYTNATEPYFRAPQILIALPMRYNPDWNSNVLPEAELKANGIHPVQWRGVSDVVFMTSRGGNKFDRKFVESFVRPGLSQQNWAARSQIVARGIVQTGPGEISFFVNRGYATLDAFVERMTLRLDGFASLHAGYPGGSAITKPLTLRGNVMQLNYSSSPIGYVKVVLLDANGKEVPGFGEADAVPLRGDKIDAKVIWKSGKLVRDLGDAKVRIKFIARDADIYSVGVFDY